MNSEPFKTLLGPRQLPAVQASLPLTEQAKCRDFWHVLAARDEPAAPVVVVCCCITLCLSLCGSLWWCGVCRRGRSEWRSECAVTFHRVCMVWGHVWYDSKHSDSPGHVSTKQGHLWRKQLVPAWFPKNPAVVGQSFPTERLGFSLTSRLATPLDWPSHHTRPGPPVFFFHPESAGGSRFRIRQHGAKRKTEDRQIRVRRVLIGRGLAR